MIDTKARVLAQKLMEFNFAVAYWKGRNYNMEFDVNRKRGKQLTIRQFTILMCVHNRPGITITQIEEDLQISKSSLSLTISRLVLESYLTKEAAGPKEDKRLVKIFLTEKGASCVKEKQEQIFNRFEAFYESLNEQQKVDFEIGIEKLSSLLMLNIGMEE